MEILVLVVVILVVVVVRMKRDLTTLREELESIRSSDGGRRWPETTFAELMRRVAALETEHRARPDAAANPAGAPEQRSPATAAFSPAPPAVPSAAPLPLSVQSGVAADRTPPRPAPPVADRPAPAPAAAAPAPADAAAAASGPPQWRPIAAAPAAATGGSAAPPPPGAPSEAWEVVVGTSWLNKIGVVVFVVGLALLLGYSMAHVGPLGRVAMGYALSVAMLGTGVVLERRERYRNYAFGLVGGGWAGVYFTAFAMHALPAARVVESELTATASLVIVAAGMIAHSLRYRSQTLTSVAFVAAYAPLTFSPLTMFSLVAAVPLTATLLAVASRFAWTGTAVLGLVSAYGIFILRTAVVPWLGGAGTALGVLWTYWLLFETADIAARRRMRHDAEAAPLFVLNACGFLGAILVNTPPDPSQWLLVGSVASAYVASALARTWLLGRTADRPQTVLAGPFTTVHAATLIAAGMFAYAIDLRFSGTRQTVAFLVETQMLVAAAMALGDPQVRRIGTGAAMLTTVHLFASLAFDTAYGFSSLLAASSAASLVAVTWHFNREWIVRRRAALDPLEHLYPWVALAILVIVVLREVPMFSQGAVVMTWSLLLLEAGVRRADDYRLQAYAALAVGACLVADVFLLHGRGITVAAGVDVGQEIARQAWRVLPVAAALAYAFAGRLALHSRGERTVRHAAAAAAAATVGTVFVALFEYRVTPAHALAAIWAGTGAAAAAFGAWRAVDVFRWHGCALAAAGAIVALAPLVLNEVDTRQEYAAAASVIVFTYLAAFVGRRGATGLVASALGGVAFAGNALQTLFVWRVVPADAVAPVWAASAVALVTMGALRRRPEQRWQGYALIVLSTGRALLPFAATSLTTAQTVSSVLVIALAYAASYVGRALPGRAGAAGNAEEQTIAGGLSWLATAHLGIWINEVLPPFAVPACMAASAAGLLVLGVARPRAGQRWQAYGLFAFSGLRLLFELGLAEHGHAAAVVWAALAIAMYFASGLGLRTALRRAAAIEGPQAGDEYARRVLLVGGSILLSVLIADEVGAGLLTLAWALQGAAVLAAGFLMRERVLRLSGLALLFVCILKLFAYDLRQLEALARILSFVVLGLVLLAVSWIYTRYREQIRRLL